MFEWWPKGRIRGEYRDPMTGNLLHGTVTVSTPVDLRSAAHKVVIPQGRLYHRTLNTDESIDNSFDFEVFTNLEGVDNRGWGWVVIITVPGFWEYTGNIDVVAGETTDMSELW